MKRSFHFVLSVAVLLASAQVRAEEALQYAYAWPLQLDGDSSAWQIELPMEVIGIALDPSLRDLVVIDDAGRAVATAPRLVDAATPISARSDLPLFALPSVSSAGSSDAPLNLRIERDADGRVRTVDANVAPDKGSLASGEDYLIDASRLTAPIGSLRLDWNEDANATGAQFAISASDDLQTWHTLVANAGVISLAREGNHLERHDIPLGAPAARYLRLHRLDAGAALPNLRASAITISHRSPQRATREWLGATAVPASNGTESGPVEYHYTLPAALSIEALKLDLGSDNAVARVSISSRRSERDAWTPRAEFTAFRLQQSGETLANDEVALPTATRDVQWRVRSTSPLNRTPTLEMAWRHDRFVFLGDAAHHYRLAAGSALARRADYPVETALAQLRSRFGADWQPPLVRLGERETLAGEAARHIPVAKSSYDWKTTLLWAVLVAAAGLIGYLALSLLRESKSA